jgi:pseudouridine-5'-monophosphatase
MASEPIDLKSPIFIPTHLLKSHSVHSQTSPTGSVLLMTFFPAQAFIFDLDGTLLDTEPLYTLATQQVFDRYDKLFTLEFKRTIVGREAKASAAMTVEHFDLPLTPDAFLAARGEILQTLFADASPILGAQPFLSALHHADQPVGIATSSSRTLFELKRSKKPWLQSIDHTLCGDEVTASKPEPEIFLKAATLLDVDAHHCVVFEDAESGIEAAKRAGMTVICVDSPYIGEKERRAADAVIRDFTQVRVILTPEPGIEVH